MKKAIVLILSAVMLLSCTVVFAEAGVATPFTTVLLKSLDNTADAWMEGDVSKTFFGACGLLDYGITEGATYSLNNLYSGTVIVGRSATVVAVGYNDPNENLSIVIAFDTSTHEASYMLIDGGKSGLEQAMNNACKDGYSIIDPEMLRAAIEVIQEALTESDS